MAPFDCWLCLRGLRSLGARMRLHCANAAAVASFLEDHVGVAKVHYPGLASHPGHATAARQMKKGNFGGMLSFEVVGGERAAINVAVSSAEPCSSMPRFICSCSLHRVRVGVSGTTVILSPACCSFAVEIV